MKKYHLFLILLLSALIISCSSEERILQKDIDVSLLQLPTQKIEVNNYENSGIDFIISPITTTNSQKAKVISSDSTNSEDKTQFVYEISTKYPEKNEPVLTTLVIQPNKDGSMTSTHFVGDYELATLKYDNQGNLVDVIIPADNNSNASYVSGKYFSKQSLSYSCINKEYQKIKALIERDMANDITCDLTWPICRTLMVMTAIENCR